MRKIIFAFFLPVVAILIALFFFVIQSNAGTVTSIIITPSSNETSATGANYTVQFTPSTNVPSGGAVMLKFYHPMGYSFGLSEVTLDGTTSSEINSVNRDNVNWGLLAFGTTGLTGGNAYSIKINNVTNPSNPGMYIIAVATYNNGNYIDGDLSGTTPSVASSSFQIGTATFKGTVTNPSGNPVSNAWVNIFPASPGNSAPPSGSSTNVNGDYLISTDNLTANTDYILEVYPPFEGGGNMIAPDRVTLQWNGSTATIQDFQFQAATKTITGLVKYSDNNTRVTGATINAFKMNGSGFAQTTTDDSGNYSLSVGGGNWGVMPQQSQGADWSYGDKPHEVSFSSNTDVESKTENFTVDRASATIRGRIVKPNGEPVNPNSDGIGGVGVYSQEGKGGGSQLAGNGTFSIGVPAGTYNLNIWAPPSSSYGTPNVSPITVKDGDNTDLGDLQLTTKDASITGSVKTSGGTGISGVKVNAFVRDGAGFSEATTDGSGNFNMSVVSGRWMVMPFFDSNASYALNQEPQEVSVTSGGTAGPINFTAQSASSTINGTVVDSNGSPVSVYGYAFAETEGGGMFGPGGLGGPIERGSFSFKVPTGSYVVKTGLAPGSSYTPGEGTSVTLSDSETENITITLKTNDASITGSIVDDSGNAIASSVTSQMFVFAISGGDKGHSFQQGTISGNTYTVRVASGEWSLGYFIDPSAGYMSAPPDPSMKMSVSAGGSTSKNIVLKAANSTISGTVYQPGGTTPATGVFVSVDNRETEGKEFFNGAPTDTNGNYSIRIASGTYKVRVNVAPNSGNLSPPEQNVTVAADSGETVNYTLRQSDATISGNVKLDGSGVPAFIYAWAEDGGFAQSLANSSGNFSLSVSQGTTWHVGGHYENGTTPYESTETSVNMTGSTASVNVVLTQASYNLPQALTLTFDSTKPKLISLTDGTEINIPASALATSGNVTLRINPKASLPTKKGDKPLWYGYEFTATDSNGQTITSFNSSITITFPYTEAQLTRMGITADDLVPSYWDETSGAWKKVSNVTVNTTAKTITVTVDHFTDFALTANTTTSVASSTPTSTTGNSSSSGGAKAPEIYIHEGKVIKKGQSTVITEPDTLPWDGYVHMNLYAKKHPYHFGSYWQVTDVYELWFKSFFNDAKILYPNKPSILSLRYTKEQLERLPENSLKLAYSADEGKSWKILPISILDKNNKTVAALTKLGGRYMLVSGYGAYIPDYGAVNAQVVTDSKVQDALIKEEIIASPTKADISLKGTKPTQATEKSRNNLLQRIVDFLLGRN